MCCWVLRSDGNSGADTAVLPAADAASDSDRTVPVSPPRPLLTAASRHDSFALSPARSVPGLTESPAAKSEGLAALDGSRPQPQAPPAQNGHLASVPAPTPFDMFGNQTQQASNRRGILVRTLLGAMLRGGVCAPPTLTLLRGEASW